MSKFQLALKKESVFGSFGILLLLFTGAAGLTVRMLNDGAAFLNQPLCWFFTAVLCAGLVAIFLSNESFLSCKILLAAGLFYQAFDMGYRVYQMICQDAAKDFILLRQPWWICVTALRVVIVLLSLLVIIFLLFQNQGRLIAGRWLTAIISLCFAALLVLHLYPERIAFPFYKYLAYFAFTLAVLFVFLALEKKKPESRKVASPIILPSSLVEPAVSPAPAEDQPPESEPEPLPAANLVLLQQSNKAAWELIADLCDLKEAGLMTEEEYETKANLIREYKINGSSIQ